MEELNFSPNRTGIFNGPVETGIRSLVILDAAYPRHYDINELVWFDHLIVHSEDVGGPPSMHPKLPQRTGEVLVRRSLVQEGLGLMHRLGLISVAPSDTGVYYQATDDAHPLVKLLNSEYSQGLKSRAQWLADFIAPMSGAEIKELILAKIGNWEVEFQGDLAPEVVRYEP